MRHGPLAHKRPVVSLERRALLGSRPLLVGMDVPFAKYEGPRGEPRPLYLQAGAPRLADHQGVTSRQLIGENKAGTGR